MEKEKKEVSFRLRMSAKDRKLLEKNAKNDRKSASEYVRKLLHKDVKSVKYE